MKTKTLLLGLLALFLSAAGASQTILPSWNVKPTAEQLLQHDGFTVSYNDITKCPNWVSWELTPEEAAAEAVGRTDFFTTDPLVSGPQAEYSDYTRNPYGLDRGHMAPSADFRWSRSANEQTFYLTNICPQDHTLNEGLWLELEQRCRAWAKRYNTAVQIICGPIHSKNPNTIGKNKVWVPEAFFKIVLMTIGDKRYCITFIFPNKPLDIQEDIFNYLSSSQEISRKTGLDTRWLNASNHPGKEYPFDIPWKKPKR